MADQTVTSLRIVRPVPLRVRVTSGRGSCEQIDFGLVASGVRGCAGANAQYPEVPFAIVVLLSALLLLLRHFELIHGWGLGALLQ